MLEKYLVVSGSSPAKYKGLQMSLFKKTSLGLLLHPYQPFQHQLLSNKKNHFEKWLVVTDS